MTDEAPSKVEVVAPVPIPVVIAEDRRDKETPPRQNQRADPSVPAKTTFQQDLITAGQRRINVIWEITQATVTVLITLAAIYCGVAGVKSEVLNFAFIAIISTYYARTNHTKIGGVGANDFGR